LNGVDSHGGSCGRQVDQCLGRLCGHTVTYHQERYGPT
jgi:hypothetical protein